MRYMCLIYDDEAAFAKLSDTERSAVRAAHRALADELRARGQWVSGSELAPARSAATIRVRNSKMHTMDGPFAETREQLAGYYVIETKDIDEARAVAARIPISDRGVIEVRALV